MIRMIFTRRVDAVEQRKSCNSDYSCNKSPRFRYQLEAHCGGTEKAKLQ
jgi:hypothetical protein